VLSKDQSAPACPHAGTGPSGPVPLDRTERDGPVTELHLIQINEPRSHCPHTRPTIRGRRGRATGIRRARTQAMGTSAGERLLSAVERLRSAYWGEGVRPAGKPSAIGAATAQMAVDGFGRG
jgi:hypothetical protein